MRLPALALLWFIAVASYAEDIQSVRGRLIFSDGNQITGQLIAEGVFASDRFGEVRFQPAEARFEAIRNSIQTARIPSAASPAETELAATQPPRDAGKTAPRTDKTSPVPGNSRSAAFWTARTRTAITSGNTLSA